MWCQVCCGFGKYPDLIIQCGYARDLTIQRRIRRVFKQFLLFFLRHWEKFLFNGVENAAKMTVCVEFSRKNGRGNFQMA